MFLVMAAAVVAIGAGPVPTGNPYPPSASELYRLCQREAPTCAAMMLEAQDKAPDLCRNGKPWSGSMLAGVFTSAINRQPSRLHLPAMDAAQAAVHDVMGCTKARREARARGER